MPSYMFGNCLDLYPPGYQTKDDYKDEAKMTFEDLEQDLCDVYELAGRLGPDVEALAWAVATAADKIDEFVEALDEQARLDDAESWAEVNQGFQTVLDLLEDLRYQLDFMRRDIKEQLPHHQMPDEDEDDVD